MGKSTTIGFGDADSRKPGQDYSFTAPIDEDFEPYGQAPPRGDRTVQAWLGAEFRLADDSGTRRAMHLAIVDEGESDRGLLFTDAAGDDSTRWLQCCTAVGWLDDDTLVYESRKADPQLIAWSLGSDDFESVTRITDLPAQTSYVASWAFAAD